MFLGQTWGPGLPSKCLVLVVVATSEPVVFHERCVAAFPVNVSSNLISGLFLVVPTHVSCLTCQAKARDNCKSASKTKNFASTTRTVECVFDCVAKVLPELTGLGLRKESACLESEIVYLWNIPGAARPNHEKKSKVLRLAGWKHQILLLCFKLRKRGEICCAVAISRNRPLHTSIAIAPRHVHPHVSWGEPGHCRRVVVKEQRRAEQAPQQLLLSCCVHLWALSGYGVPYHHTSVAIHPHSGSSMKSACAQHPTKSGGQHQTMVSIRKSCDACNASKKKCDGDGVSRCRCHEKQSARLSHLPRSFVRS